MTNDSTEKQRPGPGGISLDTLVLILVTGMTLHQDSFHDVRYITPGLNAIAVGLLGLYVLLDVLGAPLREGGRRPRRLFFGGKSAILAGIVALLVLWPTVNLIGQRHADGVLNTVHDTSINVEEGAKFLLAGKDFYAQTYFNTPLAQFGWHIHPGYGPNPALWLTDTFPAQELITVPFMLASNATLHWFDERFIYMAAFALTVLLLVLLAPTASTRLALVAAVTLNPVWIPTFIYGQNDILVLAEILAVVYFSGQARWRLALLALAIGCATKQTMLLLVPFYLWWLWLRLGDTWRQRLERLALLAPWLIVPGVLMIVPFYAWDPTTFYNGNFAYVNGSVPHSYPIQGFDGWGAAGFVLWGGLVPGPNAYYPFWIMQGAVALPLALILLRRMRRDTTPATMLAAYAAVLFPIFYFSRFFHASYIAFLVSLVAVAYFAHRPRWVASAMGSAGSTGFEEVERRGLRDSYLSFDLVVLFLLVPQVIGPPTNLTNALFTAIPMGLLLAYTVVAVLVPWGMRRGRIGVIARAIVLAGLAQSVFFAQLTLAAADRLRWNYPAFSIRDTALQTWIGAGDLLAGQNPYTSSFMNSALPQIYIPPYAVHAPVRPDLPLTHYPHLPLGALLSLPFQAFFGRIGYFFDQSYVYLPVILVMLVLVTLLVRRPARQIVLLCAILFSPLFAYAAMQGQDDVLVLVPLLAALWLLQRRRLLAASLAVGVAVAFKLTAWPLVPLLLAYYAGLYRDRYQGYQGVTGGDRWRRVRSWVGEGLRRAGPVALRGWVVVLPLVVTAIPFLRWNAQAFLSDAFAYPLGLMRNAIPLQVVWGPGFQTLGFGRVALTFGWARVNGDGYIGPYLAAGLGLLALGLLAARLYRAPSIPLLMAGYVALLFVLEYFGRFMVDTSLGYLAVLAPLAFFLPPGPTTMAGTTGRRPPRWLPWDAGHSLRWLPWVAGRAPAAVSPTPTDPGELVAATASGSTERAMLSQDAPAFLDARLANLGYGNGNGHGQPNGNDSESYVETDLGEVSVPMGGTRAVDSVVANGRHLTEGEAVAAVPIAASEEQEQAPSKNGHQSGSGNGVVTNAPGNGHKSDDQPQP